MNKNSLNKALVNSEPKISTGKVNKIDSTPKKTPKKETNKTKSQPPIKAEPKKANSKPAVKAKPKLKKKI